MQVKKCLYCGSSDLTHVSQRADGVEILQCNKCDLLMVERYPNNLEGYYSASYFGPGKDTKLGYSEYFAMPAANVIGKYAFARLFMDPPARHLDLGAADGSLMEIFKANCYETQGLDISKKAAAYASQRGLDVSVSDLGKFPHGLGKFGVITAFDLLEHVPNPGTVLKSAAAHLSADGYLVFSTLAVTQLATTEYWFNNSLEHVVYFTKASLTRLLEDNFGAGSYEFYEVDINGIHEFWGIARQGRLGDAGKLLANLRAPEHLATQPDKAFLVSLMYNQLGRFKDSRELIRLFQDKWLPAQQVEATFYLNYFQGKFEQGTKQASKRLEVMPAAASIFWQAYGHAERATFQAKQEAIVQESNEEILGLREQVFQLKSQVHRLRSYPVIGSLIKGREEVGTFRRRLIGLRIRVVKGARWRLSRVLPSFIRVPLKKMWYFDYRARLRTTRVVSTRRWHKDAPLVTVVVPYYNKADTIDDTINSLRAQTFRNFEVLIINDGSQVPGSVEKLAELDLSGLQAQVLHQTNRGTSATRNVGIKKARGKYVVCLDSDDVLAPTFIEKCTIVMESDPTASVITTDRDDFGVSDTRTRYIDYDPLELYINNMVITAAQFRKDAWQVSGGYKSKIGYEDWEFWINLAENGYWGKHIPEILFHYRIAMQSRFVDDKDLHFNNVKAIRDLHPKYRKRVSRLVSKRQFTNLVGDPNSAFTNLADQSSYLQPGNGKPNVLITIPWMNFGGAETLIYNYCRQIKDEVNLSFITGLQSEHEWDYKFQEITPRIYHMANLFRNPALHYEFIANYIQTHRVDVLHIIHNGFTFEMLPRLKERFPNLKVVVTLFNDRVGYFDQSMEVRQYIDRFTSDNSMVDRHYKRELGTPTPVRLIPNGINCYDEFSLQLYDRDSEREALGIEPSDIAVYFVGRLSEEKNPDVFIHMADKLLKGKNASKLRFFMVGDGPMRPKVDKLLKETGNTRIKLLGYHSEVAKYLSTADIFVLPSAIEGFPLSILEAMAMELGIVASHVGAVPDVIESGVDGFVEKPGSVDDFADAVKKLVANPKLLESFRRLARAKVEQKYSTAALGQNYVSLYQDVLK